MSQDKESKGSKKNHEESTQKSDDPSTQFEMKIKSTSQMDGPSFRSSQQSQSEIDPTSYQDSNTSRNTTAQATNNFDSPMLNPYKHKEAMDHGLSFDTKKVA